MRAGAGASIPAAPPESVSRPAMRPPDVPPRDLELMEIDAAMRSNDCSIVDNVVLMLDVDDQRKEFVRKCQVQRRREIVLSAMAAHDCGAVMRLPGYYPRGLPDGAQRFVYHCWMAADQMDLDSCIGMTEVGDQSSLPLIVAVLQRTPPERSPSGRWDVIDTAGACLGAFERITHRKARDAAPAWGPAWSDWARAR